MFISQFVLGVAATLAAEFVALVIYTIYHNTKNK